MTEALRLVGRTLKGIGAMTAPSDLQQSAIFPEGDRHEHTA
jgi:hypothetical protein